VDATISNDPFAPEPATSNAVSERGGGRERYRFTERTGSRGCTGGSRRPIAAARAAEGRPKVSQPTVETRTPLAVALEETDGHALRLLCGRLGIGEHELRRFAAGDRVPVPWLARELATGLGRDAGELFSEEN
jgi:hypothetical protein